ncbi:MAG: hypothetical protein QNK23_07035 [Crocinitomicaceae bacterium]|nr:hypothetical protein [Crocinitomicaceae bacterium]
MKKGVFLLVILLVSFISKAQEEIKEKEKNSYAKGTFFFNWGYNRSAYTKSDLRFTGEGYDFVLKGSVATDAPETFSFDAYFNPNNWTRPQYNFRIGYYFKDHWAISFGQDHMKYLFRGENDVLLDGHIDAGVDTLSNWSGDYNDEPVITDRTKFHYENSDGLNYLRFEITRTDQWLSFGKKKWFAFSSNAGLGIGGILSFNDFMFAGRYDQRTVSLSGYGISGHIGARFEFFRHLFIQSTIGGGFIHQVKVKTRPNDPSAFASQKFGYIDFNTVVGGLIYF